MSLVTLCRRLTGSSLRVLPSFCSTAGGVQRRVGGPGLHGDVVSWADRCRLGALIGRPGNAGSGERANTVMLLAGRIAVGLVPSPGVRGRPGRGAGQHGDVVSWADRCRPGALTGRPGKAGLGDPAYWLVFSAFILAMRKPAQRQLSFPIPLPQEKIQPKESCSEISYFSPDFAG